MTTAGDHALARDLAQEAGQLLLALRAGGGEPDTLREAGDRRSHEFLAARLAELRPHDAVLSEEAKRRLTRGVLGIEVDDDFLQVLQRDVPFQSSSDTRTGSLGAKGTRRAPI